MLPVECKEDMKIIHNAEKLYDYADFIKLRLVISLYCSRQRTIMYSLEVQNGLYDTKRGRRKMGRDTS